MKLHSVLLTILSLTFIGVQAQNDYFFPSGSQFDSSIPEPREVLKYDVGEFHTRIDLLHHYLRTLAESSNKVTFQVIGYTNEMRPQVVVTITSPENHARLEEIRTEHLKYADPDVADPPAADQPAIVLLGYNVHGNEPSSTEAAMLMAYYLTASTNAETNRFLDEAVIMIDPAYNPDGRDRHTTWVNYHKGDPPVSDPMDREHNEGWPRGRTNHYWFDLNRDWLPLAQVESRNRVDFYHKWLPNVATDYHEMGTNSTYFYEPTEPYGSENPLVPRENYDRLNVLFADYYEKAMNEMHSMYYSRESYDNSYPGYGSTYPDMQGGLGVLFEQASSRGHVQETLTKPITFAFTIRNHVRTSLATVRASVENREDLLDYQSRFFRSAKDQGSKNTVRGYVFGDPNDKGRTREFLNFLLQHRIEVRSVRGSVAAGGKTFREGEAYMVPNGQEQYLMVQTIFEPVKQFHDSVFYDASAWTMALGFGLPYERLSGKNVVFGDLVTELPALPAVTLPEAQYAYVIPWNDYYAPKTLFLLQESGLKIRIAGKGFTARLNSSEQKQFDAGAIIVALGDQLMDASEVYEAVKTAIGKTQITGYSLNTGRNISGSDLGSNWMRVISPPKALMIIGGSSSSYEAGEIWHLMDKRVGMPITKVDQDQFGRINLNDYNTMILVSGNYSSLGENAIGSIREWVRGGGTLILQRSAVSWAVNAKLVNEKIKRPETDFDGRRPYTDMREDYGSRSIGGSIYLTDIDITNPIGFGLSSNKLPVYRNHTIFLEPSSSPYHTVAKYTTNPHLDGYIHPENLEFLKGTASVVTSSVGRGRAILFVDNPNFRGYWWGTNKMFFNAIFLRELIN